MVKIVEKRGTVIMDRDDEHNIIFLPGCEQDQNSTSDQNCAKEGNMNSDSGISPLPPDETKNIIPKSGQGREKSFEMPPDKGGNNKGRWMDFKFNTASGVIGAVIASVLFLFLTGIFTIPERINTLEKSVNEEIPKQINTVDDKIEKIDSETLSELKDNLEEKITDTYSGLDKDISELKDSIKSTNDNLANINQRIDSICFLLAENMHLKPTPEYTEQMIWGLGQKSSFDMNTSPVFATTVAYSSFGGEYTAEQLAELKILLPYKDNDAEGIFYGSFSENNHWDGNCIINLYRDNKLVLITDAIYDDGEMISCKQVFPDTTTGATLNDGTTLKQDIWVVSDRVIENGVSRGETWHYFRDGDFKQQFDKEQVTAKDIISADDFESSLTGGIEGYYSGNVENGFFNDDSGNACMVKFFPSGYVKTLYIGKFKNGQFDDATGSAWMKGKKNELQPDYSYYVGVFENGMSTNGRWENIDDINHIENVIAALDLPCDLRWGRLTI